RAPRALCRTRHERSPEPAPGPGDRDGLGAPGACAGRRGDRDQGRRRGGERARPAQAVLRPGGGAASIVTGLDFLSPDRARSEDIFEPRFASPLARVLAGTTAVRDLSRLGKIEVRVDVETIDVDADVIRITPRRALVLCPYGRCSELRAPLPGGVLDMTGALSRLQPER